MRLTCLAFTALFAVGCGGDRPKLVAASGNVVFQGKPLVPGVLTFHPAPGLTFNGDRPSCQLGPEGVFVAKTYPHGEGVPPGEYTVTLSADAAERIKRPQYADPAKSPLKLTVSDAGVTGHTFEIK